MDRTLKACLVSGLVLLALASGVLANWIRNNWARMDVTVASEPTWDLEITTTGAGQTFAPKLTAATNVVIVWGDGAVSNVTSTPQVTVTHAYASSGIYTASLSGYCQQVDIKDQMKVSRLLTPIRFTGLVYFKAQSVPFTSCATNLFTYTPGVSTLYDSFRSCSFTTNLPDLSNLALMTGNSLRNAFHSTAKVVQYPEVNHMTNLTDLTETWIGGRTAVTFPAVSNMVKVTTLAGTWSLADKATNFPYVNTLTNVTTLSATWYDALVCQSFPEVSELRKVTILDRTWLGCRAASTFPSVDTLTNVTVLQYAWANTYSGTNYPAVDQLTRVTTLAGTWQICTNAANFPSVATLTNVTTLFNTWARCTAFTNTPDSLFGDYSGLTKLTDSRGAFSNCVAMSGVGSNFVNAVKSASYTVGTASTNSSYRTFYNCTNLSDWATIPAEYK